MENKETLTETQKQEAKYAFDLLDISHDGTIALNDVKEMLRQINQSEVSDEELLKIFEEELGNKFKSKKKEDIKISFEDFLSLMKNRFQDQDIATELTEAFKILGGEDNKINPNKLVEELTANGESLPKEELENLLFQIKNSNYEFIKYDDLINTYCSPKK